MWNHFTLFSFLAIPLAICIFGVDGERMQCEDREDQVVCNTYCRSQNYAFGKCDYSKCACYGQLRRTPTRDTFNPVATTNQRRKSYCITSRSNRKFDHDVCRDFCYGRSLEVDRVTDTMCCCK